MSDPAEALETRIAGVSENDTAKTVGVILWSSLTGNRARAVSLFRTIPKPELLIVAAWQITTIGAVAGFGPNVLEQETAVQVFPVFDSDEIGQLLAAMVASVINDDGAGFVQLIHSEMRGATPTVPLVRAVDWLLEAIAGRPYTETLNSRQFRPLSPLRRDET